MRAYCVTFLALLTLLPTASAQPQDEPKVVQEIYHEASLWMGLPNRPEEEVA